MHGICSTQHSVNKMVAYHMVLSWASGKARHRCWCTQEPVDLGVLSALPAPYLPSLLITKHNCRPAQPYAQLAAALMTEQHAVRSGTAPANRQ